MRALVIGGARARSGAVLIGEARGAPGGGSSEPLLHYSLARGGEEPPPHLPSPGLFLPACFGFSFFCFASTSSWSRPRGLLRNPQGRRKRHVSSCHIWARASEVPGKVPGKKEATSRLGQARKAAELALGLAGPVFVLSPTSRVQKL